MYLQSVGAVSQMNVGDTANKIGTYNLAVVARENGIPVYACVPLATVDFSIANGDEIEIELRGDDEVANFGGSRMAPVRYSHN